jgi:hypothetical protein
MLSDIGRCVDISKLGAEEVKVTNSARKILVVSDSEGFKNPVLRIDQRFAILGRRTVQGERLLGLLERDQLREYLSFTHVLEILDAQLPHLPPFAEMGVRSASRYASFVLCHPSPPSQRV